MCNFFNTYEESLHLGVCKLAKYEETRPSILCVTHQMNHKRRNYSAVPYEMMNYKWYQQVLGQYKAILSGTWWYWVSKNWHCLVLHGTGSA